MVMVASGHLILSRQNPIEPLWITYYVFMTLNFDNMLLGMQQLVQLFLREINLKRESANSWERSVLVPQR